MIVCAAPHAPHAPENTTKVKSEKHMRAFRPKISLNLASTIIKPAHRLGLFISSEILDKSSKSSPEKVSK